MIDPVAATKAYLEMVPLDVPARSAAYFGGGYWLQLWSRFAAASTRRRAGGEGGWGVRDVTNSFIRTTEAEPDLFGLNAARQPDGFATNPEHSRSS
jgi:hypothetical protein